MLLTLVLVIAYLIEPVRAASNDIHISGSSNTTDLVYSKNGDKIYYDNSGTKFSEVYCYMWEEDDGLFTGKENNSWNGDRMTYIGNDMWEYTIKDSYNMVIFNNGEKSSVYWTYDDVARTQTDDLQYPGNNRVAFGYFTQPFSGRTYPYLNIQISWSIHVNEGSNISIYYNSEKINGINVCFNTDWFFNDSINYNHDIAILCSQLLVEGYQDEEDYYSIILESDLALTLEELGFSMLMEKFVFRKGTGRDEEDYYIASRPINKNGQVYNLVFVGCIGSNGDQWNSNFDPFGKESKSHYEYNDDSYIVNHHGFNDAKMYVYNALTNYLSKCGYTKENTKILLMGHSRGAAAANLLAAKLIDESNLVYPNNLFTYTYATPNCTTNVNKKTGQSDSRYNRVFNIVNPTDFVTKVLPHDWGYGRYGTTISLPAKTNDTNYKQLKSKMIKYYNIINNAISGNAKYADYESEKDVYSIIKSFTSSVHGFDDYYLTTYPWYTDITFYNFKGMTPFDYFQKGLCPFAKGQGTIDSTRIMINPIQTDSYGVLWDLSAFFMETNLFSQRFFDAHKIETYCAYMLGLSCSEVTANRRGYKGSVNCPVDVEIIEKTTGEIVGRIVDNSIDEEIAAKENSVVMTVSGDEKEFWLPYNGNYDVRLIGNDEGTMDYSLCVIDSDRGEVSRTNFNDIVVETNKAYTCTLADNSSEGQNGDNPDENESSEDEPYEELFPQPVKVTLIDEDDNEILADESFINEERIEYTIETSTDGSGSVSETITVTSGDYVTLVAKPYHSDFLGWYQGETLLTTENDYRFRPTDNVTLIAKFTEAVFLLGDADGDNTISVLDATIIQRYLAAYTVQNPKIVERCGDINGEGLDILDATLIQRYLVEYAVSFPISEPINDSHSLYVALTQEEY